MIYLDGEFDEDKEHHDGCLCMSCQRQAERRMVAACCKVCHHYPCICKPLCVMDPHTECNHCFECVLPDLEEIPF